MAFSKISVLPKRLSAAITVYHRGRFFKFFLNKYDEMFSNNSNKINYNFLKKSVPILGISILKCGKIPIKNQYNVDLFIF